MIALDRGFSEGVRTQVDPHTRELGTLHLFRHINDSELRRFEFLHNIVKVDRWKTVPIQH